MTPEQALNELRKEMALNERLAGLLKQVAKSMADQELRHNYTTNEPAIMIRQTGIAQGIEKLVTEISKPPARTRDVTAGKEQ